VITQTYDFELRQISTSLDFTTPLLHVFLRSSAALLYPFIMVPNRNLRIRNTHRLGSPPPPFACPHCLRHFHSKGGRTKHIRAKHADELEPHESSSPPPFRSSSQKSFSHKSHEPPQSINGSAPDGHSDAALDDINIDINHPDFNFAPPEPFMDFGEDLDQNLPPANNGRDEHSPSVTRAHHPMLNGKPLS
jgi:hypothetical protein